MDDIDAKVSLSLPADPGSISVVRAVVASVASKLDLSYDSVDDLRIAVAEAAAMLLSPGAAGARLCVDLDPGDAGLRLTIWVEGSPGPDLSDRDGLAWRVMEGLTDEAVVRERDGGGSAIELLLRAVPQ